MRHFGYCLLMVLLTAFCDAPAALAQTKIAIVDLRKVFDGYHRTKQGDADLKQRGAELEASRDKMFQDYQAANEQHRLMVEQANNQALSATERAKQKGLAEEKLRDIQRLEQDIASFDRQARSTLEERKRTMRESILREIRAAIATKARAAGYTLVLDSAAESISNTPVVLFEISDQNITDEILKQLNASAPQK